MRTLVTVAEVRTLDVSGSLGTYTDAQIEEAINDVSYMVEVFVGYELGYLSATALEFTADGSDTIGFWDRLPMSGGLISIKNSDGGNLVHTLSRVIYYPENPPYDSITYEYGVLGYYGSRIIITADWGWKDIPESWKYAAFRLIRRYLTDESFRAVYQGISTSVSGEQGAVRSITSGQSSMTVTFSDSRVSSVSIGADSLGDTLADRTFGSLRRKRYTFSV